MNLDYIINKSKKTVMDYLKKRGFSWFIWLDDNETILQADFDGAGVTVYRINVAFSEKGRCKKIEYIIKNGYIC